MTVYVVDLDDPDRRGFSLETVLSAGGGLVGPLGAVWVSSARLMYWNPAEPIVDGVNPLAVVANSWVGNGRLLRTNGLAWWLDLGDHVSGTRRREIRFVNAVELLLATRDDF